LTSFHNHPKLGEPMSLQSEYEQWDLQPRFSVSLGFGVGIAINEWRLNASHRAGSVRWNSYRQRVPNNVSGPTRESFALRFHGAAAGPGASATFSLPRMPSAGSTIRFVERSRCARDYAGAGFIVEIGAAALLGGSAQALVFAPYSAAILGTALTLLEDWINGRPFNLPPAIPAIGFAAGVQEGLEAAAGVAVGRFEVHSRN
jgi:hypothetical protein